MLDIKECMLYDSIYMTSKNRKNYRVNRVQELATSLSGKDLLYKKETPSKVMKMFCMMFWVVITWIFTIVKTHRSEMFLFIPSTFLASSMKPEQSTWSYPITCLAVNMLTDFNVLLLLPTMTWSDAYFWKLSLVTISQLGFSWVVGIKVESGQE